MKRQPPTIERSVISGCGQGHEPAKKLLKEAVDQVSPANLAEVEIQVKEGGTGLHKTIREINFVYKGFSRYYC